MSSEDHLITDSQKSVGFGVVSLPRRFASIACDALVLAGVIFIVAQPFPLIPEDIQNQPIVRFAKQLYLLSIGWLYFGWFWTHSGQTVGMKAWRLQAVTEDGGALDWGHASRRYFVAIVSWLPAGLGYWWSLFDTKKRAWHDTLSQSRLVLLPKGVRQKTK